MKNPANSGLRHRRGPRSRGPFLSKSRSIAQLQLSACETRGLTGVMEDAWSDTHQVLSNSVTLFNSVNFPTCASGSWGGYGPIPALERN